MDKIFLTILNMSVTASFVIAVVCAARFCLRRMPKVYSYALWAVVLFNLICPFKIESAFSLIPFMANPVSTDIVAKDQEIKIGGTTVGMISSPYIGVRNTYFDPSTVEVNTAPNSETSNSFTFSKEMLLAFISRLWPVGIAGMLIYAAISYAMLKRKLRFATKLDKDIFETDRIRSPFVFGFVRPKIYLPVGLAENDISYILWHEQIHIRRRDYLIKPMSYLALSIHWFNPLVWLSYFLLAKDMEMSCDERVLNEMGNENENIREVYSNALLRLATGKRLIGLSPLAFGEGNAKERIMNVLNFRKPSRWVVAIAAVLVITLSMGCAVYRSADGNSRNGATEMMSLKNNNTANLSQTSDGQKAESETPAVPMSATTATEVSKPDSSSKGITSTVPTATTTATEVPGQTSSSDNIISVDASQLAYEQRIPNFFASNNNANFMNVAYKNNFFVTLDKPIVSNSNGLSLALDRYILTGERSVFRFKVSGLPDDRVSIKFDTENGTYTFSTTDGSTFVDPSFKLKDGNGITIYDTGTDIGLVSMIYETDDGVFLELSLGEKNNSDWGDHTLEIPDTLRIEIDGLSIGVGSDVYSVGGQWTFSLPVDDLFKNVKPLNYEVTNPDYCNINGINVDKFYSTATATRMVLTIDYTKNSIVQSKLDNDIFLFKDPKTHKDIRPYEQKLFVEANGEQLFETAKIIDPDGSLSDTLTSFVTNYYWTQKTDTTAQFFLYLPPLYFAKPENVTIQILDENKKSYEINLQLQK